MRLSTEISCKRFIFSYFFYPFTSIFTYGREFTIPRAFLGSLNFELFKLARIKMSKKKKFSFFFETVFGKGAGRLQSEKPAKIPRETFVKKKKKTEINSVGI